MTTLELLDLLSTSDTILPRDLLKDSDENRLYLQAMEILDEHRKELETNKKLQNNLIELVTYLYVKFINRKRRAAEPQQFDEVVIKKLLSLPEPA